jgi:hypothetical protein
MRYLLLLLFVLVQGFSHAQLYDCEEELFPKQDKQTRLWGYVNFIGEWRVDPVFIKAYAFEGKNAVVMKGTKFGVLDCSGKLVVMPVYDQFASFSDGKGWAKAGNVWGLVDKKGKVLIAPTYDEVREVNPTGIATWVRKGDKWGLMTKETGRFIIPLEYDNFQNLSDSAGILRKENNWFIGYYGDGRLIYSHLSRVSKLNNRLVAFKNSEKKWGIVDVLAYTIVRPQFDSLYLNGPFIVVKSDQKYGLKTLRGQDLAPAEFDDIRAFVDGAAPVKKQNTWGFVNAAGKTGVWPGLQAAGLTYASVSVAQQNNKWGLYSLRQAKAIVPFQYDEAVHHVEGEVYGFREKGKLIWFNNSGNNVGLPAADSIRPEDPGSGCRIKTTDGWGYFDLRTKSKLHEGWFEKALEWESGLACVKNSVGWGVLNQQGKWIVQPQFEAARIQTLNNKAFIHMKTKDGFGLTSHTGKVILPPSFDNIWLANDRVVKVMKKKKWGLVDISGKELSGFAYDNMSFGEGQPEFPAIVEKAGRQGLLSEKGVEIVKPEKAEWRYAGEGKYVRKSINWRFYNANAQALGEQEWDEFKPFENNAAPVRQGTAWGFVGANGKILIQPAFEDVSGFAGNAAYFKQNGKWGAMNRAGKVLLKPEFKGYRSLGDGRRELFN